MQSYSIIIQGIRGVPAKHGGFETFAENLCKYLSRRHWRIIVYCQENGTAPIYESDWNGIRRIHIPVKGDGALSTVIFDLRATIHSLRYSGIFLTLGYNTAIFNVLHRLYGKKNVINMDGIEWKRQKWGLVAKAWFWLNERLGCWLGNHLVADHPRIKDHLATRVSRNKITMIPYGGVEVKSAAPSMLNQFSLKTDEYAIVIARAEPENSILEIVEGFSARKRNKRLVVLGKYEGSNPYHREVMRAASDEVDFVGAIYDAQTVNALRFFARAYVHGHQVGGTNPSLVEALGAGNAVIAHDNPFNRWVAAEGAIYAQNAEHFDAAFKRIFEDSQLHSKLKCNTQENFQSRFRWETILTAYENLLLEHYPKEKL